MRFDLVTGNVSGMAPATGIVEPRFPVQNRQTPVTVPRNARSLDHVVTLPGVAWAKTCSRGTEIAIRITRASQSTQRFRIAPSHKPFGFCLQAAPFTVFGQQEMFAEGYVSHCFLQVVRVALDQINRFVQGIRLGAEQVAAARVFKSTRPRPNAKCHHRNQRRQAYQYDFQIM